MGWCNVIINISVLWTFLTFNTITCQFNQRNATLNLPPYGKQTYNNPAANIINTRQQSQQFNPPQQTSGVSSYTPDITGRQSNVILAEPTYFIVSSRMVRPGQIYRVFVSVLRSPYPLSVRASLLRNGVDIGSETKMVIEGIPETLLIQIPTTTVQGQYKLRVEGNEHGLVGGTAFVNETNLIFSQRSMTIFIQTDKPVYMQSQVVRFRAIPINTELKAFNDAVDIYMKDPKGYVVRRWLSRQSNFGAVSLEYELSDQPVYGNWTILVVALGQEERETFSVEEYYQTRYEVNVSMPAFFFDSDEYLYGSVMANYTSGGPVKGNLTIRATIKPIRPAYRNFGVREPDLNNFVSYRDHIRDPSYVDRSAQVVSYYNGYYNFRFSMRDLESVVPQLDGMEVTVTASVGELYLNQTVEGFAIARIFNSSIKMEFLGGTPQVFKPSMPYTFYIAVSYYDGSPLTDVQLGFGSRMTIQPEVVFDGSGRQSLQTRDIKMMTEFPGIWKVEIDLRTELGAYGAGDNNLGEKRRIKDQIRRVRSLQVSAQFKDSYGRRADNQLLVAASYSPNNRYIQVTTSTEYPKVGEYIIFHVRTNFFLEEFNYLILSKGVILATGTELIQSSIKTFAVPLSAEMAPAATLLVYHVTRYGDVVADSLTYPVNGISRNNFTVSLNNKKEKTGNFIEVVVRGEPGAYVGLSGIDHAFYSMQAGNEISYAEVLSKMITFDEDSNGTLSHIWTSREGMPEDMVYFPSSTYGIDANRTFEYAGLVIFSDVLIERKWDGCNRTAGFFPCLTDSQCYRTNQRCDGTFNCHDKSDETRCPIYNKTEMVQFRKFRFNRLQRLYDNVWLWKDINIGPLGHFIFNLPVPVRPALWMVSAFGMSPKYGFGLIRKPIMYSGARPFFINVEMPSRCRQGEQIGIRVTVFNYMTESMEPLIILANSPNYKFVHVESYGMVTQYNPRTSFGEQQVLVYLKAQDATVIYFPIVATVLGEVNVTIKAHALIARDQVTRTLIVDPDGVPQYRHSSILLDLSNRAYVFQFMHVNITETPIIPYDYLRYYVYGSNRAYVSIVGDIVGPAFPSWPMNSSSMLDLPLDCAEQNMFSFAANLYTVQYMRLTNQHQRRLNKKAFYYLNTLYQRQLSFQKMDGSFSFFRSDWNNSQSSVWLTAYCARVFQEASFNEWENYLYIDPEVISRAISWLLNYQTESGSFYEVSFFADRKMNSTLAWEHDAIQFRNGSYHTPISRYRNISLTAHVLLTLNDARNVPGDVGPRVAQARQQALHWLEINLNLLDLRGEPYEVALVAYALLVSKSAKADEAFGILSRHARREGGYTYWGKDSVPLPAFKLENNKPFLLPRLPFTYDASNIETTAYALLTYNLRQEMFIEPIIKWINSQRLSDGGWSSTQDTAIAMKALIDYTVRSRVRDVTSLTLSIEAVALPGLTKVFHINQDNLAELQKFEIPNAWGTVKVEAKGAGYAILQMSTRYNIDHMRFMTNPPTPAFDLYTRARFEGRNASFINYYSCQKWINTNESDRSGMAVLEINIPTGYFAQQQDLDYYVLRGEPHSLRRMRYFEDKVVFYFDYLDTQSTCVNLTIKRWYPVANMTRYLAVKVYDYYAPERFKETIIDAFDLYTLDICQVCGSYQCPYCPIYSRSSTLASGTMLCILAAMFILWHGQEVP